MKSGLNACYVKPLNAEKITAMLNELKNILSPMLSFLKVHILSFLRDMLMKLWSQ